MVLTRLEQLNELRRMEALNRLRRWSVGVDSEDAAENWSIPLDVVKCGDDFAIYATLPGVDPDHIEVSVEDNVLTIRATTLSDYQHPEQDYLMHERRVGSFYRALRLPDTVDINKIQPVYKNGVLKLTIPRMESKKARRLEVLAN